MKKICLLFFILMQLGLVLDAGTRVPIAESRPDTLEIHNHQLIDNWSWLRDREDPALQGVLQREREYAADAMRSSRSLSRRLFKEYKANITKNFRSYPYLRGNYLYYWRQPNNKAYAINCRKANRPKAREEVILDENRLARGHDYFYLDQYAISPNGRYLAYTTDTVGDEIYRLYIKDLESGRTVDTGITEISECIWRADNDQIFFTKQNSRLQTDQLWLYSRESREEILVYKELDPTFTLGLHYSTDRSMIFLTASSKNSTEVRFINSRGTSTEWTLLSFRQPGHEYYPDFYDGLFYILSNKQTRDGSIFVCAPTNLSQTDWRVIVPGAPSSPITDFLVCDFGLVVKTRHQGFERLEVHSRRRPEMLYVLPVPEISDYSFWVNEDPREAAFYYTRESELSPTSIIRHTFATRSDSVLYVYAPPNEYYPEQYRTDLRMVRAADGSMIPLRLIYRRDLDLSRPHPVILSGYGAYGDSEDPYFSTSNFSLLKRGVILATAHIRGGGELGKWWYDSGKLLNKKNSFSDFIACMDYLIAANMTNPSKLVISGGSAGGLLIGAVLNLAPNKMKLVLADVPFVDPINTMLDPDLPLTTQEYEEWGNPNQREVFEYMLSYSPYDNVQRANYPEILITAGWYDARVGYWEGLKWAQKLRQNNTGSSRILYRLMDEEGHGGSGNRFDSLRYQADTMGYVLKVLGFRK